MPATLWKISDRLTGLSALIGTLSLILIVAVTLIDVVGRYFGAPLSGSRDLNQMGLVVLVFGGMALCDRLGGHIAVDILERAMPRWMILTGDIVSAIVGCIIFILLAWTTWQSAVLSQLLHLSTNIIYLPKAWFQYVAIVFSLITAFGMALKAVSLSMGARPPAIDRAEAPLS
ncbi:MAG: TRAP transporter small permease [bacterium]